MSAKDFFHNAVRLALEKDGWLITDDPLSFTVDTLDFRIDLAAERLLGAEKEGQKIAVEIKSFLGPSDVSEFHTALGQTLNYRSVLRKKEPNRILYLAIGNEIYKEFFLIPFIQEIIAEHQLKLLIFEAIKQEIVLWKE
ncbi:MULTISPECIES: XisH family protein [Aphanizomenonaceae]|uniref:XisH family protein n=1 Tax=Aphanizomenonaceae TaxID=1892259 RepID=UPI000488AD22|nr:MULTISPECIES: XisH family protein [Aphanizomenonaceae]MBE9258725.1 XisH family protein [Dolichospermum sp. LEGE 00246]MDK2409750.1 XisH family protein [Aphanizomenon sp. 202]MDK2460771.1 XisH family protein [Aphanizomenon sp. PH219]